VSAKEINQAVKNNPDKFPQGYIIEVAKEEKNELIKNFDRFNRLKTFKVLLDAFTEKHNLQVELEELSDEAEE